MDCNDCEFRPELHYDHDFQIWVRIDDDGSVLLGMTDLSQTIAGKILHVRVRRPGSRRPAGKPVATIETGKWAGPVPNPFDCDIVAGNDAVLADPALINRDPYAHWIARVKPVALLTQALAGLHSGEEARSAYCRKVRDTNIRCKRL